MKRFLSALLFVAATLAVGCENSDDTTSNEDDTTSNETSKYTGDEYAGTTTVSMFMYGQLSSGDAVASDAYLEVDGDKATVTLAECCFTAGLSFVTTQMPSLDIVLANIPETADDVYSVDNITAQMLDGEPYGDDIIKSIDDLEVTVTDDGDITVAFDCTVEIDMGSGATEYTFSVLFTTLSE